MKYKIGDKVIIKTWKEMEKEFGPDNDDGNIRHCGFVKSMEDIVIRDFPDRILTIEKTEEVHNEQRYYMIGGGCWIWRENMIKYSLREKEIEEEMKSWIPIDSRFEILDL